MKESLFHEFLFLKTMKPPLRPTDCSGEQGRYRVTFLITFFENISFRY